MAMINRVLLLLLLSLYLGAGSPVFASVLVDFDSSRILKADENKAEVEEEESVDEEAEEIDESGDEDSADDAGDEE
jgi:hypothetical protein